MQEWAETAEISTLYEEKSSCQFWLTQQCKAYIVLCSCLLYILSQQIKKLFTTLDCQPPFFRWSFKIHSSFLYAQGSSVQFTVLLFQPTKFNVYAKRESLLVNSFNSHSWLFNRAALSVNNCLCQISLFWKREVAVNYVHWVSLSILQ